MGLCPNFFPQNGGVNFSLKTAYIHDMKGEIESEMVGICGVNSPH